MARKTDAAPPEAAAETPPPPSFPVVCIGASASGQRSLQRLFAALPADTGLGYVLILTGDGDEAQPPRELFGRSLRLPVDEIDAAVLPQPDRVLMASAGRVPVLQDDGRVVSEARGDAGLRPIDRFMCTLAEQRGPQAIGVILSGGAGDGTRGLDEIKAAGGLTFAQDGSAEQPGMPRSAISAGCVDFVLSPEDIGRELHRLAGHPYVSPAGGEELRGSDPVMNRVLELVRQRSGIDFANYKRNTLHRRIRRRVLLHKLDGLADYARFLQQNPGEVEALCRDILIGVTSFFRNPEAYAALKAKVFPQLVAEKTRFDPIRVWTLGCSTGEEAYSIAMAYTEFAEAAGLRVPMQVFATDLNALSVERARTGLYSRIGVQDVSPERLRRFFVEVDGSYRICKPIRDMCVFARHNVLSDPPFSRIDLITCRNLLIYLEPVLQQKLLPMLHYALRPQGYLWLGSSETIGSFRELFELEDARNKIYAKKPATARHAAHLPLAARPPDFASPPPSPRDRPPERIGDPQREADRVLLTRFAPPAVVVNADFEVIQFRGDTSAFLMPAPGRASLNLLKMLREGLMVAVRGALQKAQREEGPVNVAGLRVSGDGGTRSVDVTVMPLKGAGVPGGCLLVTFESTVLAPAGGGRTDTPRRADERAAESAGHEIARLRQELAATRDYLQSVIEQQEAANEELQSANEEVQSSNEELQSINEELETSKEEIQSSNEELATVNDELHNRNQELSQSNNDLTNLLSSVQMAIVMLGRDLRIRRFTPAAEKLFNPIPSDVGRPIGDIKLRLDVPDLEPLLTEAIDTVSVRELDVRDRQGRWFLLRIRPYKTLENKIDGAVLVLVDVDTLKRAEQALRENDRTRNAFLAMLAHELRNPLAALQTSVDLLADPRVKPASIGRARGVMQRQTRHMKRLIDGLLDASRLSQGTIKLHVGRVDLVGVLKAAIAATEAQRHEARQRLEVTLPTQPVILSGDANRLEQVFVNLLDNASKFTPRGGHIALGLDTEPMLAGRPGVSRRAVVRVRDDGCGIDAAQLPRLFDLFVQLDASPERAHGGLGIGLALARKLVELHDGTIDASSPGLGRGAEFTVRVPLVPHGGEPRSRNDADREENPGRRRQPRRGDDARGAARPRRPRRPRRP